MPRHAAPLPDAHDAARLDELADAMIAKATSSRSPYILSANGFASENISIVHQQTRTANLAWALKRRGKVSAGDVVAVIGGSFSGMMVAVALALTTDAIVYIFEKGPHLLPRFRDKGHRHLSPVLNSRGLGEHFNPSYSRPTFGSPIFAWNKGAASEVAAQWLQEFAGYSRVLPIFTICNTAIDPANLRPHSAGVEIAPDRTVSDRGPIAVDLVVDAAGFGEESNPHRLIDFSYWESGHRLIYDHLAPPADVLISGCGDSGVIEALHYALDSFRHEEVEAFWPRYPSFGLVLDQLVADARLPDVLGAEPNIDFEEPLVSEVCWWLGISYHLRENPHPTWPLDSDAHTRSIFEAISEALTDDLEAAFPSRSLGDVTYEELEEFAKLLSRDRQFAVRDAVLPVIDGWISTRLETAINYIDLPPNLPEIHALARKGVNLTLNGLTPTPYTRQLSPYNVWVMRILMSFPNVRYIQGEIASVTSRPDRRLRATFAGGGQSDYDRLLTRYGAGGGVALAYAGRRDGFSDDELLSTPHYTAVDSRDGKDRFWFPVREELLAGLDVLLPVPTSRLDISKDQYVRWLLYGSEAVPLAAGLAPDPQAALAHDLRNGKRPTYGKDELTARAMR